MCVCVCARACVCVCVCKTMAAYSLHACAAGYRGLGMGRENGSVNVPPSSIRHGRGGTQSDGLMDW